MRIHIHVHIHVQNNMKALATPINKDIKAFAYNVADFHLSPGCFCTDIPKRTKWFQMGVHGLKIGQIFTKCQGACFWV